MPSSHTVQLTIGDTFYQTTGITTLQDNTTYDVSGNHKRTDYQYILIEAVMPSGVTDRFSSHDFLNGEPYTEIDSPSTYETPPFQKTLEQDGFGFTNFYVYAVPKKIDSPSTSAEKEYGLDDCFAVDENNIYKVVAEAGVDISVDTDLSDTSKYEKLSSIKNVTSRYYVSESDLILDLGTTYQVCLDNFLEKGKNNVVCEDEFPNEFLQAFHMMMIDYVFEQESFDSQDDVQYTITISNTLCESCGCGCHDSDYEEVYTVNDNCNKTDVQDLEYTTGFFHYLIPTSFDENFISRTEIYFEQFVGLTLYDISVSISGQQLLFLETDEDSNAIEQLTESGHLVLKSEYPLFRRGKQITVFYKIYLK